MKAVRSLCSIRLLAKRGSDFSQREGFESGVTREEDVCGGSYALIWNPPLNAYISLAVLSYHKYEFWFSPGEKNLDTRKIDVK